MFNRLLVLAVVGTAASFLLGSSLLAATSDRITSVGNQAETGDLAGAHDLQVALVGVAADCQLATYSEGPTVGQINDVLIEFRLPNAITTQRAATPKICLKNNGRLPGRVVMGFENLVDVEVADCDADEAAVDTTCKAGDPGEITVPPPGGGGLIASFEESGPVCALSGSVLATELVTTPMLVATLQPGELCSGQVAVFPGGGSWGIGEWARKQSDRLQFDIHFTLQD